MSLWKGMWLFWMWRRRRIWVWLRRMCKGGIQLQEKRMWREKMSLWKGMAVLDVEEKKNVLDVEEDEDDIEEDWEDEPLNIFYCSCEKKGRWPNVFSCARCERM
ncbi:hypothetical protein LIER_22812 [Lithospermum erythrorhizon]|uniref:Uncharacterized protein n=1 Tax=Lithospermum erythrorhizon TaxID=34254 RepID=A0AAV3QZD6_LITER